MPLERKNIFDEKSTDEWCWEQSENPLPRFWDVSLLSLSKEMLKAQTSHH